MKNKIAWIALLWLNTGFAIDLANQQEADYAQAVVAYNSREFDRALHLLDVLLQRSPQATEILELKALTLMASHKDPQAASTYESLIRNQGDPVSQGAAPYQFELGMIRYKEN